MSTNPRLLDLLPREARLLLLTAGGGMNDEPMRQLLTEGVRWDDVRTLFEWERALPVAWHRLKTLGVTLAGEGPGSVERLSRVAEFTSMMLEDGLRRLIGGFEDEGIPAILLKGAGLGLAAYDRFSDRPMGDLDVLISPRHSRRAWEMALAQGWSWDEAEFPQQHYRAHHHLPPLYDTARTGTRLELHTALSLSSHPFSLSFEEAQAVSRAVPGRGAGLARVLDPEHALIHLGVHFAWGHLACFGIWRLARDVAVLTRRPVDWDRLVSLARQYRAEPSMYWSFRLIDGLCGVSVPAEVVKALAPRKSEGMLGLLERHLAMHAIALITPCPSDKLRRFMWSLALSPDRTAITKERPWDSEPARRPTVFTGDVGIVTRIKSQLTHGGAWRRYLKVLRPWAP